MTEAVIFKYVLPFKDIEKDGTVRVLIPFSARVLSALWCKDQIVVYARHAVNATSYTLRDFKVFATGQKFEPFEPAEASTTRYWEFLGTVSNNSQTLVFHVYHQIK